MISHSMVSLNFKQDTIQYNLSRKKLEKARKKGEPTEELQLEVIKREVVADAYLNEFKDIKEAREKSLESIV